MTTQPKKRVFLSFVYEDIAQVNGLAGLSRTRTTSWMHTTSRSGRP